MDVSDTPGLSARQAGLARCGACGILQRREEGKPCRRCGTPVHSRKRDSLQRTWAFLLVGLLAYIPANVSPIMLTRSFSGNSSDTILSGIVELVHLGSYGVAGIVFVASICIPVTKFVVIAALALSLHRQWNMSEHARLRLHRLIEFIGRWSMIDVFVVAVLAALIQLGAIITVLPGPGINAFAVSVVFTMLSANALDPRLLWDLPPSPEARHAMGRSVNDRTRARWTRPWTAITLAATSIVAQMVTLVVTGVARLRRYARGH